MRSNLIIANLLIVQKIDLSKAQLFEGFIAHNFYPQSNKTSWVPEKSVKVVPVLF